MAKAGIKIQATSTTSGVLVINTVQQGDIAGLLKGHEAEYTFAQGGGTTTQPPNPGLSRGSFISVPIVQGATLYTYKANGNLTPLQNCPPPLLAEADKSDIEGPLVPKRGQIVTKNPKDQIVENPVTGNGYEIKVLSNPYPKGEFVYYTRDALGTADPYASFNC